MATVIAVIADDSKKDEVVKLAADHLDALSRASLIAPQATAALLEAHFDLDVAYVDPGPDGIASQLPALIAEGGVDLVVLLVDPRRPDDDELPSAPVVRACRVYDVPLAGNPATARLCLATLRRPRTLEVVIGTGARPSGRPWLDEWMAGNTG
jgi:methylglyoxal synthase